MLNERIIDSEQFKLLLEEISDEQLEQMANRVATEHLAHFGKAIILYTPLYLANHCVNQCVYCGYNAKNKIKRHQLSLDDIKQEAKAISNTGLKHILILTGESEKDTPLDYIIDAVKILKLYFDSVAIEIYPLSTNEYREVIEAGVDSLTIYQEVYNRDVYKVVHPYGPKSDYDFRYHAAERGAEAGMFNINIGALLGLHDWQEEVYHLALHAKYLEEQYPEVTFSLSVPRIRPFVGQTYDSLEISDRNLVQIVLALKLFLPKIGITLSTRENKVFRTNMLPLGITKLSAGVMTSVGGHDGDAEGDTQFDIADNRSVEDMINDLKILGYQPVLKDWVDL